MKKILFICLGNICRSPMAEFIMRDLVKKAGVEEQVECASAATSTQEIIYDMGNPMYPAARAELKQRGIPCGEKRAVLLKRADYDAYDYLICMDRRNLLDAKRILGGDPEQKLALLQAFAKTDGANSEIADPWYTGDFVSCADQITEGCEGLLKTLGKEGVRAIAGGNMAC